MPPKKKGSSKKPPKVKTPILMDGLTKDEMTREQMVGYAARLQEELDRVREEKKSFKQERDQYLKFLDITQRELKEAEAELKNEQKGTEEDKRRHQEEIQVIKQEMKYHLCQHQNTISELKADASVSTEAAQEEQRQLESELHEKIQTIKQDMQKLDLDHENHVKELEAKHDEEMTKTRDRLEEQLQNSEVKSRKEQEQLKQEMEKRRKRNIRVIEDQWEGHITILKKDHKETIKNINKLVEELGVEGLVPFEKEQAVLVDEIEAKKGDLPPVLKDQKRLTECLSKVSKDIAAVERHLKYKVTKNDTERIRQKELADLEKKHEALQQKFSKLQLERDELYKAVPLKIQEVQQKAEQRGELLERKLSALTERRERTRTQLDLVLSDPNVDQTALREVLNQVEEKLDSSNTYIKDLKHKIALIAKSRKDLLQHFEATQRALGVPVQELHVEHSGSGPAGKNLGQEVGKKIQDVKNLH